MRRVTQAIVELLERGERAALGTVIRTSGSTPQQPGARILLSESGELIGTVGGGAIELAVIEELRRCLRDGKPQIIVRELAQDLGMCCGGRMEVFVEVVETDQRLFLFGAGHVAHAIAQMAALVGFDITVIDSREELNSPERFPTARRILAGPREATAELAITPNDWLLIMTHDHRLDEEALDMYARLPHRYIGMIGSKRKVFRIVQRLHARGQLPPLDRVYAPVGLDIAAVTPAEIAISVMAEIVALRHGASGNHLRALDDPRLHRLLAEEDEDSD